MKIIEKQVILKELRPSQGMILTDKETETMRAEILYLGKEDSPENYKEIDKDTPIEDEATTETSSATDYQQ